MQEKLTFKDFLLKIFLRGCLLPNDSFMTFRNVLPRLVATCLNLFTKWGIVPCDVSAPVLLFVVAWIFGRFKSKLLVIAI